MGAGGHDSGEPESVVTTSRVNSRLWASADGVLVVASLRAHRDRRVGQDLGFASRRVDSRDFAHEHPEHVDLAPSFEDASGDGSRRGRGEVMPWRQ